MAKKTYIHAGAHRSGTSSFQLCLSQNRSVLQARGYDVAYPERDGAPDGGLRLALPAPRHGHRAQDGMARRTGHTLSSLSPDPDRSLILSEENIPGRMVHFYSGRFFPAAAKRMRTLARALDAPPAHVVYVIRNYAGLYASAYRKRAEDNLVTPFREVVPNLMAMDRGWPELVQDLQDNLAPDALTIVDYARRGDSRSLLAGLVPGFDATELREPDQVANLSATDAALLTLQDIFRSGGTASRDDQLAIIAEHAGDRKDRGFASFTAQETAALDALYARDLARIGSMPGVTLIAGPGAAH